MTSKKTKRDVQRLADRLGAELLINSDHPQLDAELVAPFGHYWTCEPYLHALVGCQNDEEPTTNVWTDMYDRAKHGVTRCDDPEDGHGDCEFWAENSEESE